ncbi:heme-binding protein [Rhodococcus sp. IEGM 1379]|uniref:SOUL family heme-binding protein n=1 Tax=Rhodococcus sp. IEGM 1379 TaxID=3047086 RepID=UPI0024B6CCD3|nr:heme-binding protein [Rhodococcus sp. IEGM 1379]MDI9918172.1 heme-binding protein [Rhodococcus sp. IEGM 1379]
MSLVSMVTDVAKGFGSLVGLRSGTEEPRYDVQEETQGLEIRRYGPRIAAETTVPGDEESARSAGFRRLAGYIFGANVGKSKIAMTAPVSQASGPGDSWVVRFYMPSQRTMDTLPTPEEQNVELVEVLGETMAALRFTGDRSRGTVAARTAELLRVLEKTAWVPNGEPVAWFYDPPWTISFLRRNEVVVPVKAR